ncbi:MAG: alpha/beta hydrolase-fold protein [Planctomycetaceae bacterium]
MPRCLPRLPFFMIRCGLSLFVCLAVAVAHAADARIEVTFSRTVRREPYSGRVYLFFSKDKDKVAEPRFGPDWFHPEPFVAVDIENWKPDEPLTFDPAIADWMLAFPQPLARLDLAGHRVQAVARFNPFERRVGTGPGNGFSAAMDLAENDGRLAARLTIDQLVEAPAFPETKWCKLLEVPSPRLSEFHRREVSLRAAVLLPASYYEEPARRYPVIFIVPGFGGSHTSETRDDPVADANAGDVEFVRVRLDPGCPLGHHCFADSANNGPVGAALVTEFIPEFERRYRTVAAPHARFLTGHSSGGWSTLWLQVTYPEQFGGVWSTAPDPVDFREFQRIDLYQPVENMYRDREGNRRPIARQRDQVLVWYDDFDHMEEVLGPGGQLHSFEAVFSPRGADGRPVRIWDRKTGVVETALAQHWKEYDIRLILESRWPELAPKIAGRLHVFMGERDTFYLEGATRLLKESLESLGSDAVVELIPERDHTTLLSPDLRRRIRGEMAAAYLKNSPSR